MMCVIPPGVWSVKCQCYSFRLLSVKCVIPTVIGL